jgi:NCS1 family nucleobase:cation symporter-1
MIAGTAAALLCVNTAVYVGPVAGLLDGADLSSLVGPVAGAALYAVLTARQRRGVPAAEVTLAVPALTAE